jgi:hypothetical protein
MQISNTDTIALSRSVVVYDNNAVIYLAFRCGVIIMINTVTKNMDLTIFVVTSN